MERWMVHSSNVFKQITSLLELLYKQGKFPFMCKQAVVPFRKLFDLFAAKRSSIS